MVWLWRKPLSFIPDLELEETMKKREEEDIVELVKEEVPLNQECQLKSYGWEDKEF